MKQFKKWVLPAILALAAAFLLELIQTGTTPPAVKQAATEEMTAQETRIYPGMVIGTSGFCLMKTELVAEEPDPQLYFTLDGTGLAIRPIHNMHHIQVAPGRLNCYQPHIFQQCHFPSKFVSGPAECLGHMALRQWQITRMQMTPIPFIFVVACICQTVQIQFQCSVIPPGLGLHDPVDKIRDLFRSNRL